MENGAGEVVHHVAVGRVGDFGHHRTGEPDCAHAHAVSAAARGGVCVGRAGGGGAGGAGVETEFFEGVKPWPIKRTKVLR